MSLELEIKQIHFSKLTKEKGGKKPLGIYTVFAFILIGKNSLVSVPIKP